MLSQACRISHGVWGYWRYEDDLLVHYRDTASFTLWLRTFRQMASYFTINLETASLSKIVYLNVEIAIDKVQGRFRCKPYFKPNAMVTPLSEFSSHQPSLHYAWPKHVLRSLGDLCSTDADFAEA